MSVSVEEKCEQLWKLLKDKAPVLRPKIIVRGYDDDQLGALCRSEEQREELEAALDKFARSKKGQRCSCCGESVLEGGGTFASEWDFDFTKKRQILTRMSYLCETCYSLSDLEEFLPLLSKPNADVLAHITKFHTVNGLSSAELSPVALIDYVEQCYSIAFALNLILAQFPSWTLYDPQSSPFSSRTDFSSLLNLCFSGLKTPATPVKPTSSPSPSSAVQRTPKSPKTPKGNTFEIVSTPSRSTPSNKRKNSEPIEASSPVPKKSKR